MYQYSIADAGSMCVSFRLPLTRWRSEGIGPVFLKLQGQVRYRIEDIEAFEADSLRKSTSEREVVGGAA